MTAAQHSEECVYSGQAEKCDGSCTRAANPLALLFRTPEDHQ